MKVLPPLCKDSKHYVFKVVDILVQLLTLTTDPQDKMIATNCLLQVFKEDPLVTLKSIFHFITTTENTEKAIQFVFKKIIKIEDKLTPEVTDLLLEQGKNIIQVCF